MNDQPRMLFLLTANPGDDFTTFMNAQVGVDCWAIQRRQYVDTRQTFYRVTVLKPVTESIKTIARIKFNLAED
jgi:hypothetical protein